MQLKTSVMGLADCTSLLLIVNKAIIKLKYTLLMKINLYFLDLTAKVHIYSDTIWVGKYTDILHCNDPDNAGRIVTSVSTFHGQ